MNLYNIEIVLFLIKFEKILKRNKYILHRLIVITALSNIFLSNIPNFSPIASLALFSGFYFSNKN